MATGKRYVNRILRINLMNGSIVREEFNPSELRKWVGGNGVALKILYDEVPPEVKPLSPENKLIFAAGPLNGTKIPGSGIFDVAAKGPLTNMLVSAQANGSFGARMRHACCETIVLEGAAPEWSYIWINDNDVQIRSAEHLLGLDTWKTEERLREEPGKSKASVVCIGPAAENMIPFAALMSDHGHVASTNGPGCVMASKRIKAIMITSTNKEADIWDEALNDEIRKEFLSSAEASYLGNMVKSQGTHGYFMPLSMMGSMAVKNYTSNVWPNVEKFYGDKIREEQWYRKPEPCWACPFLHCSTVTIKQGKSKGYVGEEPEFENLAAWSMMIGNDDIGEAVRLANLNDAMGFDCKEMGYTVSLVMECFNDGLLTLQDTGGLDLTWGNTDAVAQLIEDTAHRRRFGAKLAGGVKATAEMIGGDALNRAVYIGRGQAPNVVDARGMAIQYYMMTITDSGSFYGGAAKDPAVGNFEEVGLHDLDMIGKAGPNSTKRWVMQDAVGCCMFFLFGDINPIIKAVNAATGWDMSVEEYVEVGHRIMTLSRAYNILNGLTAEMEIAVSPRMSSAPVDGPQAGAKPHKESVFREYYRYAGWDEATSKPLPETLKSLGLEYIINDLWAGKAQ